MITQMCGRFVWVVILALVTAVTAPAAERATKSERRSSKSEQSSSAKVDLNSADLSALEQLPGVGPATARAIVQARPFATVDDLERVPGIGPGKLEQLRDQVTVSSRGARAKASAKKSETAVEKSARRSPGSPAASSSGDRPRRPKESTSATRKVDVNTATLEELEALPGIGAHTAQVLIAARPFKSVDDLERVQGIGPARLEALRDHVTVSTRSRAGERRDDVSDRRERERDRELEPTGRTRSAGREATSVGQRRVNLNTATQEELEALPEIGPVRAKAIIEARPFKSLDDLKRVKGIKDIRLEELRPHVTVQ